MMDEDSEATALLTETAPSEYSHQKQILIEACEQGRAHLLKSEYLLASKSLSQGVMAFEYILKNNSIRGDFKTEIKDLLMNHMIRAYSNLSLAHLKLENHEMGKTFANQVLAHEPNNVKNLYRKGLCCLKLMQFDEAIESLTKGKQLDSCDSGMEGEWSSKIKQCQDAQAKSRRRQKKMAQQFLSGYQREEERGEERGLLERLKECLRSLKQKGVEVGRSSIGGIAMVFRSIARIARKE